MEMDFGVKSARRAFEFLEYMAKVQRAVSVAEIAQHYAYPNSSVSSVMRTMVGMGYLSYDASARTYLPTARLPFLINWVGTKLFQYGRVKKLMVDLSEATGETIILGVQNGLRAHYVHVIEATSALRLHAEPGSFRPLAHTAIGLMLLSRFDDRRASNLLRRINAEEKDLSRRDDIPRVIQRLQEIRSNGYALSIGGMFPGGGALAMFLPQWMNGNPLAIAVASGEAILRKHAEEWPGLIRGAIARHYEESDAYPLS